MQDIKNINNSDNAKSPNLKVVDYISPGKEITTVFHKAEEYINQHYQLRYNTISLDIEWSPIDEMVWTSCNDNSLWIDLQKKGIKIGQSGLRALIKSDFVTRHNPLIEYFENLPEWDGKTDYITQYASFVKLMPSEDKEQFLYHFKKWCVRAIKCVRFEGYFNKQAFVLTDDGKGQNLGKSTWCRFLCPPTLSQYIAEDISSNDKDARILLCKNFLIVLDELSALSRKDINNLKSLFSKDQINDRLPYDSKNSIIQRVASFIGSTNMSTFLHDETGSVRWLCFVIEGIDWSYKETFNIDLLWSQAYSLSKDKSFIAEMTREDIIENERRNDKFQFLTAERELLQQFFAPSDASNGEHLTATQISMYIRGQSGMVVNAVQVGKALKALKFEQTKVKDRYGYYVIYKPIQVT